MGTFILSNEQIVTTKLFDRFAEAQGTPALVDENAEKLDAGNGLSKTFVERLTTGVGHFYAEFMLVILFFYIAGSTIGKVFTLVWKFIKNMLLKITFFQTVLKSEEQIEKDK